MSDVRADIKEVRELSAKYGRLIEDRTMTFPEVAAIISYYEDDGENEAVIAAEAALAEAKKKLSQAQGAAGGLTRRINALEAALSETSNVKSNNAVLARISMYATEMIEHLDQDFNRHIDVNGEALTEHPLYIRLRQEIGIEDDDGSS